MGFLNSVVGGLTGGLLGGGAGALFGSGLFGGGGNPPPPPDPKKTAKVQYKFNKKAAIDQAYLNQVNQVNPFGSLTYDKTGETNKGIPQFTATQTLSPELQNIFGNATGALQDPFDLSGLGAAPQPNEDYRSEIMESLLGRQAPVWEQDRQRLETMMANQGIAMGSEAWNRGIDDFNRSQTDYRLAADQYAGNEMSRMYGLQTDARSRAIEEMKTSRTQGLNEFNTLRSGNQFINQPQIGINPGNYQGAAYQSFLGNQNNYNQQEKSRLAMQQGLFQMGGMVGAGAMMSDRRLKTNIRKIGKLLNGLGVYLFNYIWGGPLQMGVMADEVRQFMPHAVIDIGGFDAVNYAEVLR